MFSDDDNSFLGLFFQDKQMCDVFDAYPELLCVDATYKLLDLRLPVYLMLCEDSNGQSAVCILVTENAEGIRWMFETFKAQNAKWCDVKVVMSDKDINEREVIKEVFPDASVLICLFHTLRTFRREVTCERMGITSGQRSSQAEPDPCTGRRVRNTVYINLVLCCKISAVTDKYVISF